LVGGVVLSRFFFIVDGGERAVIFDKIRGVQGKIYGEGMHFLIPVLQVNMSNPSYKCEANT
jgi:regulator of protease activity HflC (stomatin/prohibitin superfamily)